MKPKHLAGIAILWFLARSLRTGFWGLIALLAVANKIDFWNGWLAAGCILIFLIACAAAGIEYWRFTYLLDTGAITINRGLFERKTSHIPYNKIQTLQRQQWFFLRPFHLETLSIETSSQQTDKAEAKLLAVPQSVGDDLERRRQGLESSQADTALQPEKQVQAQPAAEPDADATYQISSHDLNLYALSSLGFFPIVMGLFLLYLQLPGEAVKSAEHVLLTLAWILIAVVIILALFFGLVFMYLGILQRFYHFTLQRQHDQLTTTRGFFKRNTVSVRLQKIQAIRLKQSVLRQWLHLTTVQALVASNAADDESDNDLVLMPVLKQAEALKVMHPFVDWLPQSVPELTKVPAANRWYYWRNALGIWIGLLAIGGVAIAVYSPQWLRVFAILAVCALIFGFFQGRYSSRSAGVAILSPNLLVLQTGKFFARERFFVRRVNIQSVEIDQSIWMKRPHRAHLTVNVRSGDSNESVDVRYLDEQTAVSVRKWYLREQ